MSVRNLDDRFWSELVSRPPCWKGDIYDFYSKMLHMKVMKEWLEFPQFWTEDAVKI